MTKFLTVTGTWPVSSRQRNMIHHVELRSVATQTTAQQHENKVQIIKKN